MNDILGGRPPVVKPDPTTRNQHESLHGGWWIAEFWPRIVHIQSAQGAWRKWIRFNLGRRRWISPDVLVHESVEQRLANPDVHYRPTNLPQQRQTIGDNCDSRSVANDYGSVTSHAGDLSLSH